MMGSNDDLQSFLDSAERGFTLDWEDWRNMAVGSIEDLCALSLGFNPEYGRLVRSLTTPSATSTPEEIEEMFACRNEAIEKWPQRVRVAMNHVAAGTLPIVRTAAPLGDEAIPGDADKIMARIADFVAWATALPDPWELPEEMKRMGPHPEDAERTDVAAATPNPQERSGLRVRHKPGEIWTDKELAELRAYRDLHGTKAASEEFGVSRSRISQLVPTKKPTADWLMPEKRTKRGR
jgi:hypothetical protein